ncbi:MAG: tRNA threonylcarbamoyladenosine dehydratase [Eubacterium sp.]|nr:tRNA threonylcarbamoyladenosine dehydratase [Eubacterium sp.]
MENQVKEQFARTAALIGWDNIERLNNSRVIVFGVGGVGGHVVEALARAGLGNIDIVDKDTVDVTNINRQIIASHDVVGLAKVNVMKERLVSINPDIKVGAYECFYLPENADDFNFNDYDYIVDAVDTVTAKLEIITRAYNLGLPVISAMGAGNKLDPTRFKVADIYKTSVCPLAKVMRKELKARGVKKLKVVYSDEEVAKTGNRTPASISYVPAVAGLIMAGEIIQDLIKD